MRTKLFVIQEENNQLRQRVMELEKKVSDLTATNEFLLDQNAQLRLAPHRTQGSLYGGLL
jgi:regulator of replication initiation timing